MTDRPKNEPSIDTNGLLAFDLTCANCNYNLRGLPGAGECPECGTAIAVSAHGSPLSARDPEWLATVRRGAAAMTLSFPWLWLPIAWPFFLYGLWRLTTRPPAVAGAAWPRAPLVFEILLALLLFTPLAPLSIAIYVQRLARRGREKRLAACASWVMLLNALAVAGAVVAGLDGPLGMQETLLFLGVWLAAVATPAMLIVMYVMLAWTWRMLDVAETHSRDLRQSPGAWRLAPAFTGPVATPAAQPAG